MRIIDTFSLLYNNRTVLKALVQRELEGSYKNSHFGIMWQFITPIIVVFSFYLVFSSLRITTEENYWLFLCCGMMPFSFFNTAIANGGFCIVNNGYMLKKMAFPKELIPLSKVISTFITFIITYVIILFLAFVIGCNINSINYVVLVVLIILSFIFDTGIMFLLSAVVVYNRDVGHLINAFSRMLMWVTPTFYSVQSLSGIMAKLIWYNPLTYFIDSYQELIYNNSIPSNIVMIMCLSITFITLVIGLLVFNKYKNGFTELI